MELDKKQLPQLIILGVLVLFSVGYIAFKVAAPKPAAVPPTAKSGAQSTADVTAATEADGSESEALALLPPGEYPNLSVMPARRDPFTAQKIAGMEESGPVTLAAPARVHKSRPNALVNPFKFDKHANEKVPGLSSVFGVRNQQPEVTVLQINPPEEKDPEFTLTGVVRGDENVAIIRVGQNGRYVVKEGQFVDGRYRVKSVTDDGAVLVYKNRCIYLKLGGVNNAS